MKKLFLVVAALGMLATACTKDDAVSGGTESLVSFTIDSPELATRYGEGTTATNLEWAFYDENGDKLDAISSSISNFSGVHTFDVSLVEGRQYTALFWASAPNAPYTVDWAGKTMTIDNTNLTANNEAYDAFYNYSPIDPTKKTHKIELTRPFAQINIATADTALAEAAGVVVAATKVTVENAYKTLDLVNGAVSEPTSFEFGWATKATGTAKTSYDMLAMNYVLVNARELVNVTMLASENADGTSPITREYTTVPVQRNYQTFILGNLLTASNDFTVETKPGFDGEEEYVVWDGETVTEPEVTIDPTTGEEVYTVDSGSDLAWLAGIVNGTITRAGEGDNLEGVTITLAGNIDLGGNQWTPIGYNPNDVAGDENYFAGTFDGAGYTISNLYIDVKDQGGVGLFGAVHNATIKNLTLNNVYVKAVESEDNPANTSGAEGKANYIVGGHIGAVAGYDAKAGTVKFENVHVKGLIKIEGETRAAQGQRVGGIIGGRGSSTYTFNDVSVVGDEGSYIKGYCSTAGVIGQNQEAATFEDVTTDIDVYAVTFGAGGIAGIARQSSTFTNCHSHGNITLDASKTQLSSYSANYPYRVGGIAGCWSESATGVLTLAGCSYDGALTSIDKDGNEVASLDYAGYVGRGYALKNCAGSKVVIDGVEYVQADNATYGVYTVDGVYEMNTLADMQWLANKVNTGAEYFAGKTVKLANDIDFNNVEWAPIGSAAKDHGFMGNFDGNNKTIKNLKISNIAVDSDNYAYAGLFGVTEGTDKDNQNFIKNFTIENVTINTTGHIAAAAIAYPYYTAIENITVAGNVNIKGGDYTSGVLAYTRRCVDAKNLTIAAAEGSVIEGNMTVGGVISDIQMNGGLTANYSNFAASGLTIKGVKSVGGISGIIAGQTLDGATVKNVTIVCDDTRAGIVSGSCGAPYTLTNVSYENVTGATRVVGATYDEGYYVGQIVEVAGVKAAIFNINGGVKAVSVAEQNLKGKTWQNAMDWAAGLGEGWALASMADLNAIYDLRCELNDALEADNAENALFWEGDELYIKDGSIYYALYMSSDEVPAGEADANGNKYFENRVFFKQFNAKGYSDVLYSAFDCINKYAPLRDNYFARGVITLM